MTGNQRFRRLLAILVGSAALIAAALAWVHKEDGRRGDDASAIATLRGTDIFVQLAAGGSRDQFQRDASRRLLVLDKGLVSRINAVPVGSPAYQAVVQLSNVEAQAAKRLVALGTRLGSVPDRAPGVDAPMLDALRASNPDRVDPLIAEGQDASERSTTYGNRSAHVSLGITAVAIGAALLGLAGLMGAGRPGRIALGTGGAALLAAVALGVWGLVG